MFRFKFHFEQVNVLEMRYNFL